jgi:hypothetical protein
MRSMTVRSMGSELRGKVPVENPFALTLVSALTGDRA